MLRVRFPRAPRLVARALAASLVAATALSAQPRAAATATSPDTPPPVARELRAVWVATVGNIDWPSRPGLSTWAQQAELLAILDRAKALGLNAVVFQVRPAADALYASEYEPWSEYLSGQQGVAPEPFYDPLAFAVKEAHARGLELHAWINPYRARHPSSKSAIARTHVSETHAKLVKRYGTHLWMDPGEPAVRAYTKRVVLDLVRRYDLDGVHIDDYFYPYRERDSAGAEIPFPDSASYARYRARGGRLERDDWRRENVNQLVHELYVAVKAAKPWVKFGVSPFGMWRPGYPPQIKGFDAYQQIYADSRTWLRNGWVDYLSPQLYWPIDSDGQSFPVLLQWWTEQNVKHRHIWPGLFTSRVGGTDARGWPVKEIIEQIRLTRAQPGASGDVHFSMRSLMPPAPDSAAGDSTAARARRVDQGARDTLVARLRDSVYAEPALVPASPWLDRVPPARPRARLHADSATGGAVVDFAPTGREKVWLWVVRSRTDGAWTTVILPGTERRHRFTADATAAGPDLVVVSAVDRVGNESTPATLRAPRVEAAR